MSDIEARIEVDARLVNADDFISGEIQLDDLHDKGGILERITEYESSRSPASASYVGVELD